jgi:uncharacterized protein YyaL (SSP411 family)
MEAMRFSPRPNKAGLIAWRPWGPDAFAEARQSNRLILLSISAVWCHWCHVMDETTFSDEGVIAALNESFVPVRVDNDQRPDINRRYNAGGWPTVAFLTPEGESVTAATYVAPAQFRELLARVAEVWATRHEDIAREVETLRVQAQQDVEESAPGELSESVITAALAPLYAAFDQEFGGFGTGMKFPRTDALQALLLEAQTRPDHPTPGVVLTRTLDAMREGELWDRVEKGFFRYATRRDWTVPHYEKMLEDLAVFVRLYADAAVVFDRPDYLETAEHTQAYLDERLWQDSAGGYGGSQDADEDYYLLGTLDERRSRPAPYVDPNTYAEWNALAVSGLVSLAAAGGEQRHLERAVDLGTTLLGYRSPRGLYRHTPDEGALDVLLGDQVAVLEAFLALYQSTGDCRWLDEAAGLAEAIATHFTLAGHSLAQDRAVASLDAGPGGDAPLGRLAYAQAPAQENARLAAALATLARITRSEAPRERARQILAVLAGEVESLADFGAPIGAAAIVALREPIHVTVVGRRGALDSVALLEEAVRVPRTHKVVDVLDPETDAEVLARAGIDGDRSGAQAYVCVGDRCLEPVTTAEDLQELAAGVL